MDSQTCFTISYRGINNPLNCSQTFQNKEIMTVEEYRVYSSKGISENWKL